MSAVEPPTHSRRSRPHDTPGWTGGRSPHGEAATPESSHRHCRVPLRSCRATLLTLLAAASPLAVSPASATCARPPGLGSPATEWSDVRSLRADSSLNPQIASVQTIDGTGAGDVNLDYYAITVDRTGTAKQMFADFRKKMGDLLFRKGVAAQGFYDFRGYDQANAARWTTDDPRGSLMTFVLFRGAFVEFERGSVVVSCSDDTSFVFSTVSTAADGDHPVSGNRAFGIVDNKDGSVTFFTKAADRVKGGAYFDLLGSAQREGTFAAGAHIWENLLDNIQQAYAGAHPRARVTRGQRLPYAAAASTTPPGPAQANPAATVDAVVFRNAAREYADVRALSGDALPVTSTAQMAREARQALADGDPTRRTAWAYSLGLVYASSYQENLAKLMKQRAAELGAPALDHVALAGAGLVGDSAAEAGAAYRDVVAQLPPVPGLTATDPGQVFREALGSLPTLSLNADDLRDQAEAAIKAAAYAAVNQEIERLRARAEQEATAAATNFLADNLDLDQSQVDVIMSMRQYLSLKESIRLLELRNLSELSNLAMKALILSGQCHEQPVCVAYETITKIQSLKNMDDLASWAGGVALDQVAPGAADYVKTIASYADKVRVLADVYERIQAARRVVEAAETAHGAIGDLGALNLPDALKSALDGQVEGLRAGIEGGTGELCTVVRPGTAEPPSCRLLIQGRILEDASQRLANAMALMDREVGTVTGVHASLQPLVAASQSLATLAAGEIRPRIERLYAAAEGLRRKVATSRGDLADAVAGPILTAAGIAPEEARRRADLLANLQEEARRAAEADLRAALATDAPTAVGGASQANAAGPSVVAANEGQEPTGLPISLASLTYELTSLYQAQGQTTETITDRLKESRSAFLFFRQFPPYFYSRALVHLAAEPELAPLRQSAETYRGWVVGDPHLQNFGSFLPLNLQTITQLDVPPPTFKELKLKDDCDSGRIGQTARLVMNDLDDGGEGAMVLDLVRYLLGLELYSPQAATTKLTSLLDAYTDAVTGSPASLSGVSSGLLKGANPKVARGDGGVCTVKGGMMPSAKYLSGDMTRFSGVRADAANPQALSASELQRATEIARGFIGAQATILDSYKYKRFRGGSGGNWRWELLVRPAPEQTNGGRTATPVPYWLELKGIALIPGSYPASSINFATLDAAALAAAAKNRYRSMVELTHNGDDAFGSYRLVDTTDGPALARFRFAGQDSADLEGLSADEIVDLARDQLTVLGTIHRKSLTRSMGANGPASYATAIKKYRPAVDALIRRLTADFKASYAAVPKPVPPSE